jgi:hypothetical protein
MDFNRYCKFCNQPVKEITSDDVMLRNIQGRLFKCECTDRPLSYKEVIPGFTRDARITQLKAMHQLMTEANDEGIYMAWIYRMPDCPSEEDFIDIAMDDEQYNGCFDLFVKLIAKDGNRY